MKHIWIYVVGASIILLLLALLAVKHYDDTRPAPRPDETVALKTQVEQAHAALNQAQAGNAALRGKYNALHTECVKGALAYDKLTAAAKALTPVPACGAELLD